MIPFISPKLILRAVMVAGFVGSLYMAYDYGQTREHNRQLEAIADQQSKWVKESEEVTEETDKIKVVYRDRIKIIREAADPSGCADTDVPDDILSGLQ